MKNKRQIPKTELIEKLKDYNIVWIYYKHIRIRGIQYKCEYCKEYMTIPRGKFDKKKTKFCHKCVTKATQGKKDKLCMTGNKHPRWKGEYISTDGYKWIAKEKEKGIKRKYVREHIEIYEEHLGRKLINKEIIHHIDGNKLNNNINNLIICLDMSEHAVIHKNLEKCSFNLIQKGVIKFNKETKKYYIDESRIN